MRIGRYRLLEPLEASVAGPAFLAIADDDSEWEIRLPDHTRDGVSWTSIKRRLRLLQQVEYPGLLPIREMDLSNEPPYIAFPRSQILKLPLPATQIVAVATSMAGVLAAAHRVGLSLGNPILRSTSSSACVLDLTDAGDQTRHDPTTDVARLADLFTQLGPKPGDFVQWDLVLAKMRADDRPTAAEVLEWFEVPTLETTLDSPRADATQVLALPPAPPQLGDTIGRFLIVEKIGEGGMGVVYKAEDPADGSFVALKVLRQGPQASDHRTIRRFVREGRMLGALDSPYVTRLIDAGVDGERSYLALEFVAGTNLGDRVRDQGKLIEAMALDLITDAARGLAAAHAAGMIHRDVKPDNMLLVSGATNSGPRLKVTDFGLARSVLPTESMELTRAGTAVGTPLYMAPEQFGSEPVDARVDVYALAATLFFMLTGKPPFQADGLAALAKAVAQEEAPSLDRASTGVSSATAALIARCLNKDPAHRPVDAGSLLRELEQLRAGQPLEQGTHPHMPAGSSHVRQYVHAWDLDSPPDRLWPYVSNTERLNRAVGLPSVNYILTRDPQLGTRRSASARVIGMRMEWEEHPYEWIEGRRMGVLREYSKGPFVWFLSIVDLEPLPNGGTRVKQTLRAEPRGLLGRIAARMELGFKAKKSLGRVYRKMDDALKSRSTPDVDSFEAPTALPRSREHRMRSGVNRLIAAGVTTEAAEMLALFLSNAPEPEVARIRPLALGRRYGIADADAIDACLRAVPSGLLQLQWDVICPLCRIPSGRKDTLRDLKEHENCRACAADFRTDFAASVELVFKAHPDIRVAEAGNYCAGGPAHSPHVVAQTRIAANERLELELALSEGTYRIRGPQLPWSLELRIDPSATGRRCELDLAAGTPGQGITLATGGQIITIRNARQHEIVVRVERATVRDDVLTAARAIAIPAFRDLFPDELLSPGQLAPTSSVSILWVKISDGDTLMDRLGEARAFQQIQATFRAIEKKVRSEGGVVVKAVGEGMLAAFGEVTSATRAALGLAKAIDAEPLCKDLRLQAGLHRGLALVASVNDRLDYFGQSVRLATRLGDLAMPGELLLTPQIAGDPEVAALLRGRPIRLDELAEPGSAKILVYHVATA